MTLFAKHVAICAALALAFPARAAKSDDSATPQPGSRQSSGKKAKKDSGKNEGSTPDKHPIDVPVVKGHDSIGLSIPYFDASGRRQMNFKIGVASRLDDNHVKMKDLKIETFNDEGAHEMAIDLPTSVLDLDTSVITTDKHVTIRRVDFELTGESMAFNTQTKQGGLGGGVRMLIYNLQETAGTAADAPASSNAPEVKSPEKSQNTK